MRNTIFCIICVFLSDAILASDITVIELHNKSVDQILLDNLEKLEFDEEFIQDDINEIENEFENTENQEINIAEESDEQNQETDVFEENNSNINEVILLPELWEKTNEEDFIFLLNNIAAVNSPALKSEYLSVLNIDSSPPQNLNKIDYEYFIFKSLLNLGERDRAYKIIKTFNLNDENKYNFIYKEFELNHLLSTYNLSEACDFIDDLKNKNLFNKNNLFLKIDIFCLILKEKFDEANLMNSLLQENENIIDDYFQHLYDKLLKVSSEFIDFDNYLIDQKNIFLYSAMHRVGNIPLSEKFLQMDLLNLSMPIVLSNSTDIELRLKAAHIAYNNGILNTDSLAALYQIADFNSQELNDPLSISQTFESKIEIGMAYYYQLIKIQILPIARLEAILNFWKFAEKNNLELIAYNLSEKSLDTIEPTNDLSGYGVEVVKAYTHSNDFEKAKKWLIFAENVNDDDVNFPKLQSSKLLLNLFNIKESQDFIEILLENLKTIKPDKDNNDGLNLIKNEVLFTIFSSLNDINENPFTIDKKIDDSRLIPSAYLINNIRECINNQNHSELLLSIILSLDDYNWNGLHPEHMRLILIGLQEYKNGIIFNDILMEILDQNRII